MILKPWDRDLLNENDFCEVDLIIKFDNVDCDCDYIYSCEKSFTFYITYYETITYTKEYTINDIKELIKENDCYIDLYKYIVDIFSNQMEEFFC